MKVVLISGSRPPDACGVGDYTHKLAEALRAAGAEVDVLTHKLKLGDARSVSRAINAARPDVVHLQYPTVGFGSHLGPQMLSLLRPGVVTMHEASRLHILRRLSMTSFAFRSHHLIFTTFHERAYVAARLPWVSAKSSVIPVGSSIPAAEAVVKDGEEIVSFGLFRPQKGLEEVLTLAELIRERGLDLKLRLVGSPDPRKMDYFEELRARARGLPVEWSVGLPEQEVSRLLARARAAYMPFPDGAVDYRTSLLALLANGVAVVTTRGQNTSPALAAAVEFAADPGRALEVLSVLCRDEERRLALELKARAFARSLSWAAIASQHMAVYKSVMAQAAP